MEGRPKPKYKVGDVIKGEQLQDESSDWVVIDVVVDDDWQVGYSLMELAKEEIFVDERELDGGNC